MHLDGDELDYRQIEEAPREIKFEYSLVQSHEELRCDVGKMLMHVEEWVKRTRLKYYTHRRRSMHVVDIWYQTNSSSGYWNQYYAH